MSMFLLLYHILLILILLCGLPLLLIKLATQKQVRAGFWQRLGIYGKGFPALDPKKPTIWIHGSSVGEIQTILPFLDEIKRQFPKHQLFFSAMTMAGMDLLKSKKSECYVFSFGFDLDHFTRHQMY